MIGNTPRGTESDAAKILEISSHSLVNPRNRLPIFSPLTHLFVENSNRHAIERLHVLIPFPCTDLLGGPGFDSTSPLKSNKRAITIPAFSLFSFISKAVRPTLQKNILPDKQSVNCFFHSFAHGQSRSPTTEKWRPDSGHVRDGLSGLSDQVLLNNQVTNSTILSLGYGWLLRTSSLDNFLPSTFKITAKLDSPRQSVPFMSHSHETITSTGLSGPQW